MGKNKNRKNKFSRWRPKNKNGFDNPIVIRSADPEGIQFRLTDLRARLLELEEKDRNWMVEVTEWRSKYKNRNHDAVYQLEEQKFDQMRSKLDLKLEKIRSKIEILSQKLRASGLDPASRVKIFKK